MRVLKQTLCLEGSDDEVQQRIKKKLVLIVGQDKAQATQAAQAKLLDSVAAVSVIAQADSERSEKFVPGRSRRRRTFGAKCLIAFGVINVVLGVLSFIWTPFELFMAERLRMAPGFPPYEWWKAPPDEVLMRVYVFNVTNGEDFLSGRDAKLRVQEIGPFVFLEKLVHTNVSFHANGTMSYVAHRKAIFLPEMTSVGLNATLLVPNLAVLGMASKLHDASFFTKLGFNMLVRRHGSSPLIVTTVHQYFWNLTDPLVQTGRKLLPQMVPTENMAVLHRIYEDFSDEVSVFIGPGSERRFFTMDRYRGSKRFGLWADERCDRVDQATEGVTYHQRVTRNDSLHYFRKTVCRVTPVVYVADVVQCGLSAFRFELPNSTYHRFANDCFSLPGVPILPSGVSDVSPCYFDFPIAASMPHFLAGDESLINGVDGVCPDREKHGSYVIVEPTTGVPMESRARSQSNLVVRPLAGFGPRVGRFSDLVLPMFWIEYNQVGLPWYVLWLMYFTVKLLPAVQAWLSSLHLLAGLCMLLAGSLIFAARRAKRVQHYSSLDLTPSFVSTESSESTESTESTSSTASTASTESGC